MKALCQKRLWVQTQVLVERRRGQQHRKAHSTQGCILPEYGMTSTNGLDPPKQRSHDVLYLETVMNSLCLQTRLAATLRDLARVKNGRNAHEIANLEFILRHYVSAAQLRRSLIRASQVIVREHRQRHQSLDSDRPPAPQSSRGSRKWFD